MSKPIQIFSHKSGPNPWKVAIILSELNLAHEHDFLDMARIKSAPYTDLNPNGRVPAITDPNTGISLWESGAIVNYLISKYDTASTLSIASEPEKFQLDQWQQFQASGQGPYFGQAIWFNKFHKEKLPSAIERYQNEVKRVTGVLDRALEGKDALVGGKVTYADLAFVPWFWLIGGMDDGGKLEEGLHEEFKNWSRWIRMLNEREAVKKTFEYRKSVLAA